MVTHTHTYIYVYSFISADETLERYGDVTHVFVTRAYSSCLIDIDDLSRSTANLVRMRVRKTWSGPDRSGLLRHQAGLLFP